MAEEPSGSAENYNLLQTNLSSYILNEIGVDIQAHESSNRSSFTAADIALDPLAILSKTFDSSLSTNVVEGKVSAGYYAIVLLSFKDGPGGAPACKAVVPGLHDSIGNPFMITDEDERAMMISHFPTFTFEDGPTATSSPLVPGSVIKVAFDNPYNYWTSGVIEKVIRGKPKVLPEYAKSLEGVAALFDNAANWLNTTFLGGGASVEGDPGNCPWSNSAKVKETVWQSTQYPKWNGTILRNGLLEETGMLVSDPVSGAKLLPPAMEDFKRLAAAYAKKFPGKTLKGSGYRPYASQVYARTRRITPGNPCGSGEVTAEGKFVGMAATPGTSNHGWGAAVDIDRGGSGWTNGQAGSSPEFQWVNKFSKNFNFVFGVRNEHWHLDWMLFSAQITGGVRKTAQTPWTSEGVNDASISLV
jgi:hypothetical protein